MSQQSLFPEESSVVPSLADGITITGSRQVGRDTANQLFAEYLNDRLDNTKVWMVGGALGLDQWAIEWLLGKGQRCCVVVPFKCEDQPQSVQHLYPRVEDLVELGLPKSKRAYLQRNEYMVDRSDVVFGFYLENKGGTFQTLQYALKSVTEVHAIPVPALEK